MNLIKQFELSESHSDLWNAIDSKLHKKIKKTLDSKEFNSQLDPTSYKEDDWFRIPEHFRVEYLALTSSTFDGVLCFKGNTFLKNNFKDYLSFYETKKFRGSPLSIYERFPPLEHKVPGLLLKHEADVELEMSIELHERHLEIFGTLAQAPVPVGVYKVPDEDLEQILSCYENLSSRSVQIQIEGLVRSGVYLMVYLYQGIPYRANDYHQKEIPSEYNDVINPVQTIESWMTNYAKLLHCGFFPGSLLSRGLGSAFDYGNLAIDGGFFDLGTLYDIKDIKTTSSFTTNFSEGFVDLTNSITNILKMGKNKSHNYVYEVALYQIFVEELNRLKNDKSKILPYLKEVQFDNLKKTLAHWKMSYIIDN